ncbi:MAG: 50S ribosomal protein L1 [Candidatus Bathyarchaeota archaeon]|jgi:large subunit ribosomal protein L1|nr:MAG: 50S ribosomal protein L1 [Candidatus Bathyarchaeota archaeon]
MSLDAKIVEDAVKQAKESSGKRKFSQTIELIVNLRDVDVKKPDGRIQEAIELPYTPSKKAKVCVIATRELALKAKKAGAELIVGSEELEALATDKKRQKKLAEEHDIFIAEAPLMPSVGRFLGAILGPRDKMPKPVPPNADIKAQIERQKRTITIRTRGQPVLQCAIGTEDMEDEEIVENVMTIMRRLEGRLKRGLKNITAIHLKTSMGPIVKVKM